MATGARGGNILPREARICPILATLLVKRMPNGSHHLAITWEIFACWFWLPIHTSISCSIWQRVPKFVLWHLVTWGGSNRRTSIRDNILCFSFSIRGRELDFQEEEVLEGHFQLLSDSLINCSSSHKDWLIWLVNWAGLELACLGAFCVFTYRASLSVTGIFFFFLFCRADRLYPCQERLVFN